MTAPVQATTTITPRTAGARPKNYDLCLNATLGREACADLIVAAARAMQEADK